MFPGNRPRVVAFEVEEVGEGEGEGGSPNEGGDEEQQEEEDSLPAP